MKKLLALLIVFVLNVSVCFAEFSQQEEAGVKSVYYLNDLVKKNNLVEKVDLYNNSDDKNISAIRKMYKTNPQSIKNSDINDFCYVCMKRNKFLLEEFERDYFKPAYNYYLQLKPLKPLNYQDWYYSYPMSELSVFYEFNRSVELNKEGCEKFYNLSK